MRVCKFIIVMVSITISIACNRTEHGDTYRNTEGAPCKKFNKTSRNTFDYRCFNEDGSLYESGHIKNGKLFGLRTLYYKNSQIHLENRFKDGYLNGIQRSYDRQGQLQAEDLVLNNKLIIKKKRLFDTYYHQYWFLVSLITDSKNTEGHPMGYYFVDTNQLVVEERSAYYFIDSLANNSRDGDPIISVRYVVPDTLISTAVLYLGTIDSSGLLRDTNYRYDFVNQKLSFPVNSDHSGDTLLTGYIVVYQASNKNGSMDYYRSFLFYHECQIN